MSLPDLIVSTESVSGIGRNIPLIDFVKRNVSDPINDFFDRNWSKVEKVAVTVSRLVLDSTVRAAVMAFVSTVPVRHDLRVWLFSTAVDYNAYAIPIYAKALATFIRAKSAATT